MHSDTVHFQEPPPFLMWGLLTSVAIHLLLAGIVLSVNPRQIQTLERPIYVDLVDLPKEALKSAPEPESKIQRQIVSSSDQSDSTLPPPTNFLSEKDARVAHEQIKRGIDKDAGPSVTKPSQPAPPPAPKPAQKQESQSANQAPKAIKQLRLDPLTLNEKFGEIPSADLDKKIQDAVQGNDNLGVDSNLSTYQPFSRPFGSGARFLGTRGVPDHLPHLPDGDITLLNTKANQFAVFVRRVALQVFGQLRSSGWELLRASDIRSMGTDSTVTAVLSPNGHLLRVSIESSSGSQRFDEVLKGAVQRGAKDPNPPPAAARDDGNIYFIFKSRSWSQYVANPRNGAPTERRWLVLATGLE